MVCMRNSLPEALSIKYLNAVPLKPDIMSGDRHLCMSSSGRDQGMFLSRS
jgi:hypothetical protein